MSRSYRHTPIRGVSTAASEKWEKRNQHRRWRAACREALAREDWERAEWDLWESSWGWSKDGRLYDRHGFDPTHLWCQRDPFVVHRYEPCTDTTTCRWHRRRPHRWWQFRYK
jgi:hypothetical protein